MLLNVIIILAVRNKLTMLLQVEHFLRAIYHIMRTDAPVAINPFDEELNAEPGADNMSIDELVLQAPHSKQACIW